MKVFIITLTVFFTLGSVVSAQTAPTAAKKEVQKTIYSCPMHPKELSEKKGKCSKCGMDLEATMTITHTPAVKEGKTTTVVKSKYVCAMDGATADKPGKCPKCGMAMTLRKTEKK